MKTIALTKGQVALVDDDDYARLSRHKWSASWISNTQSFRAVRRVRYGKRKYNKAHMIYMHREITHAQPGQQVDHINHNTLDNRKQNLRICTNAENHHNQKIRAGGSSRHKGVYWEKCRRKWLAQIRCNGKRHHVGYFDDEDDAGRAYDKAALKHHGEFANLNFPGNLVGTELQNRGLS